ncbi:methyltransferase domain-containing protein [Rhodopila sp.]|uniref:methyltransferase domain-containing protein n=1 Tax=Rhodopila sp. TaxID=2480087 RepID=UPI003D13ADDD
MQPVSPDADLLQRIPLSALTILHVGCGDGGLAAAYRLMNPRARLLGIEADPAAATSAARHIHQVATSGVEADPLPFDLPDGIDCIIYNGILEHLRDPWSLIRRHAQALSPDGMMLIRVPNPEHWREAERLLRGLWEDTGAEPRQEAHPRWFNLNAMRRTLTDAGLSLCDVIPLDQEPDPQAASRFTDAIATGLTALGIEPDSYVRRSAPTHFIWRVRKTPNLRVIVSGNMLAPVGGVSHVRVVHPLHAIGTDPLLTVGVINHLDTSQRGDDTARIFVLHRPALTSRQGHEMLRSLMQAGYLVVTEFDDHPDFFKMMQQGGELSFRGVHALQTSTPALAQVLRKYNPEIAVFPNAVPALPPVRNFADPRALTLFFGALNREACWRPLLPAINAVASKAGARLRLQIVHDQTFFEALETPFKSFTPTCDYDTYLRLLAEAEISFMPLSDTVFNRAKSDLKFIEAGACRVASLASTVVYGDSIEDERTGLLFRDATELHSRLLRLIATPEMARDLGDAARAYVSEQRMLAYQVAPRIAWYRSLWNRRGVLDAALQARMAERPRTVA